MLKTEYQAQINNRKRTIKSRLMLIVSLVIFSCMALGFFNVYKNLPAGLNYESKLKPVNLSDISLLADLTYKNNNSLEIKDQKIFDTILTYIDGAQQYILIDAFLFNDYSLSGKNYRNLASELTDKLLAKKAANSDIKIDLIIDPINTSYGSADTEEIKRLKQAGVNVIMTKLSPLRDSNPLYSAPWRLFVTWLGNSGRVGWLPNLTSPAAEKVTLRSYLAILNAKANHRKTFLADNNSRLVSIISSANPHGPSSANSNVAWSIKGDFGLAVYETEQAVAKMSDNSLSILPENLKIDNALPENKFANVKLITEWQIKKNILEVLDQTKEGDQINLAMFYLADFDVIKSLLKASQRGTEVRIILDKNRDAFGYKKNSVPNAAVAKQLIKKSDGKIQVRWYETGSEQYHTKMLSVFLNSTQQAKVISGSANFTRRNLENYNLETDVLLVTEIDSNLATDIRAYFDKLWNNQEGNNFTTNYQAGPQASWLKSWQYYFQESSGISTF